MKCLVCEGCGWVCESHPERPWEGEHACTCGGAGNAMPELQPCGRADGTEAARGFQDAGGQKGLAPLIPDKERTETSRSFNDPLLPVERRAARRRIAEELGSQ